MSNELLELLQISLGNKEHFSSPVTEDGWRALYEESLLYSVVGIAYVGMLRLHAASCADVSYVPHSKQLLVEWSVQVNAIREGNRIADWQSCKVLKSFKKKGFDGCLLKGQGNALMYDIAVIGGEHVHLGEYRTSGDIDVWIGGSHGSVYEYVKSVCQPSAMMYNHTDFPVRDDMDIEVHIRPTYMNNPIHNSRLQRWYSEREFVQINNISSLGDGECAIPEVSFNAVYQLSHLYKHLFTTGISLRQLVDYYFVLKRLSEQDSESRIEVMRVIKNVGMADFAAAVMWIMTHFFAMPESFMLCKPDEVRGTMLIEEMERTNADLLAGIGVGEDTGRNYWRRVASEQKRNWRLLAYYPSEVLCKPVFAVFHFFWRKLNLVSRE